MLKNTDSLNLLNKVYVKSKTVILNSFYKENQATGLLQHWWEKCLVELESINDLT